MSDFANKTKSLWKRISPKVLAALNGTTIGIIIGMMPAAFLNTFLMPFQEVEAIAFMLQILKFNQYLTALYIGFAMAHKVGFSAFESGCVSAACMIGSGAWKADMSALSDGNSTVFALTQVGDIVNIMFVGFLAILVVRLVSKRLGSLQIVFLPMIVCFGVGWIGCQTYPYVSCVTGAIGSMINYFTTLSPFVACALIAITYSILIITPISTIATSMAIGISGMSAAAAGMGALVASAYTIFATAHTNKPGVPVAIALGGVKMLIPNFLCHPSMGLPIAIIAAICSVPVAALGMVGTSASAGFGITGLVSPLAAVSGGLNVWLMILFWLVLPFALSFIAELLCRRIFMLYKPEIFKAQLG